MRYCASGNSIFLKAEFENLIEASNLVCGESSRKSPALTTSEPTNVSISINFTRLPCLTSVGCAGSTEEDSDHVIALSDRSTLVAGSAGDGIYNGYDGVSSALEYTDLGNTADLRSSLTQILFTDPGYPSIGDSFDINVDFTLDTTTNVSVSFLAGSGSAGGFQGLDRTAAIDFVFLSEGDPGEQYQINSLTFTSDALSAVPIPAALWLFGSGLLGLIGVARKEAA